MKKTRDGRRQFSRGFKIAAVRRVLDGEQMAAVARELNIGTELLWRWEKRVSEKGEEHLYGVGQRDPDKEITRDASHLRRIAELERLVGRQQLEIRFLDKALHQIEERRRRKNGDSAAASSKQ
jgi:transposase-like protein